MNSSANSRNTVSAGMAPTSAYSVIPGNVSYHSGGAGRLPASSFPPSASTTQVIKGEQKFMGTVVNNNIYPDLSTVPEQPLQSFLGKQEFKKPVINTNAGGSRHASPNIQTTMQDIGDGIRVGVPLPHSEGDQVTVPIQYFEGDQVFHDDVKNANTLHSKDGHHNSAADVLQSFVGGQKFRKGFENDNTVNSNNDNDRSETTGGTMRGTSIRVNGVDVTGGTPQQSANRSWTDRLFRGNLLQRFQGNQEFMGNVTDKNTVN